MTTDINQLLSGNSPARQRELAFEKAFPQFDTIIAVVDAPTPELVQAATGALAAQLSQEKDLFRSVEEPQGGSFFGQNGLLFVPTEQLGQQTKMLTQAQRLIQVLAADPSLRGALRALQYGLLGVQSGKLKLDEMQWPLTLAANTVDEVNANKPATFSWLTLVQGHEPKASDLLRFLKIQAVLDYSELEPGLKASDAIRKPAADLKLDFHLSSALALDRPGADE